MHQHFEQKRNRQLTRSNISVDVEIQSLLVSFPDPQYGTLGSGNETKSSYEVWTSVRVSSCFVDVSNLYRHYSDRTVEIK